MSNVMWVWIGGLLTIFIFSFVYGENPIYRFAEHLYVGTSAGYALSLNFGYIKTLGFDQLMKGKAIVIIPLVLGLMLFTRYFKSVSYLSRWSMSFLMGIGTGLSLYGIADAQFLKQITATFVPLYVTNKAGGFELLKTVNNIVMVVGVLGVLVYFFFSGKQQKGIAKSGAVFGRWIMMVTFGVSFGNVVMGRISLMLGSLQPILKDMLHIMK